MSQFSAGHKTPSPSPSPPHEPSGVNFKPTGTTTTTTTATHSPFPDTSVRRPVTPPSHSDYGTPLNGSPRNSNSSNNNSPPQYTRQRNSSRPLSMVQAYQPPLMDINEDTIPELQPIFSFLNSHSNKLYQEGYFLKLDDQNTRASRRPRPPSVVVIANRLQRASPTPTGHGLNASPSSSAPSCRYGMPPSSMPPARMAKSCPSSSI